jgi:hypothetical protein
MFGKDKEQATEVLPAENPEFPKDGSSGTGTDTMYSVEARFMHYTPKAFGEQLFDQRWQTVQFDKGYPGVPLSYTFDANATRSGLMTYACAEAMRWWFIAALEAHAVCGSLCWETRIVTHEVSYSHKNKAISAFGIVTGGRRPEKQSPESKGA